MRGADFTRRIITGAVYSALIALVSTLAPYQAHAHGGVSIEKDLCVLQLGSFRMHFTGYQPARSGAQEFCEDIPYTGRAIIVLDAVDDALRDMPLEIRLLRDPHRLGNKTQYSDLGTATEIAQATVAQLPPRRYPTGSLNLEYDFAVGGRYVGLVVAHPEIGSEIVAVFPFAVAATPYRYWIYGGIVVATGILAVVLFSLRATSAQLAAPGRDETGASGA